MTNISDLDEQIRSDYEKPVFDYLIQYLRSVEHQRGTVVFIDVGANIGRYSIYLAKKFPKLLAIAIEPDPDAYLALIKGVKANNIDNVIVLNIAAYDTDGFITLFRKRATTISSIVDKTDVFEVIKVRARSLDSLIKELGINHIDIVKIDVEGAEFYVLQGFRDGIVRFKPKVIIEVRKDNKKRILEFFMDVGYKCKSIIEGKDIEYLLCECQ